MVIGQRRDDSPAIDNPGKVAAFGGAVEKGEDPLHAAWREVTEETNLRLDMNAVRYLTTDVARRSLTGGWEVRHFFYAKITDSQLAGLEVYEGAGWAAIPGPDHADLIDSWRAATALLFARVERDARS
jgi:8-oxo-dGTP pyrophosphatase MutT (NUDIX family)